jgi:hypothetical protein
MTTSIRNARELVTSHLNDAIVRRLAEVAPIVDAGAAADPSDRAETPDSGPAGQPVLKPRAPRTTLPA